MMKMKNKSKDYYNSSKQWPFLIFILLEPYNCNDLIDISFLYKKSPEYFDFYEILYKTKIFGVFTWFARPVWLAIMGLEVLPTLFQKRELQVETELKTKNHLKYACLWLTFLKIPKSHVDVWKLVFWVASTPNRLQIQDFFKRRAEKHRVEDRLKMS